MFEPSLDPCLNLVIFCLCFVGLEYYGYSVVLENISIVLFVMGSSVKGYVQYPLEKYHTKIDQDVKPLGLAQG